MADRGVSPYIGTMTKKHSQTFDIAIVGGGLTGLLAALTLDHQGFTCALIDSGPAPKTGSKTPMKFDGRTTALAYGTKRLLANIGLWQELEHHACLMNDIRIFDGTPTDRFRQGTVSEGSLHFQRSQEDMTQAPLGFILENKHMLAAFQKKLPKAKNVTCFWGAQMSSFTPQKADAKLSLTDGQNISARVVLACDGRQSRLRGMANIRTTHTDYKQTAITCLLNIEKAHHNTAYQYFLPNGPLASLPMNDNKVSIVWTEKSTLAPALLALSDDAFIHQIGNRFGSLLGDISLEGERYSYPLNRVLATQFFSERLVLIGDAAHGIHPIAGQGFNLAIKDIAVLADVLTEMRETGLDIGHGSALEKYNDTRRFDGALTSFGSSAFNMLFSNESKSFRALRSLGMDLLAKTPLPQSLPKIAGADKGSLPSLMAED